MPRPRNYARKWKDWLFLRSTIRRSALRCSPAARPPFSSTKCFGHRAEGHRQKDVNEGQTFAKKVGEPILPDFLSIVDDPTLKKLGKQDLLGYYQYDDEGVIGAAHRSWSITAC